MKTSGSPLPQPVWRDKNLLILFSITLTAIMGVSSITPAFPQILETFAISRRAVGLLITIFTLPGIVLTPLFGVLADRYGRKKVLIPSLLLFGIAGTACAFTTSFQLLLLLRFFQGIGATSLNSLNVTIIGDLFAGHRRIAAMGYNASVLSVGAAAYPAVGGALALGGWNYPFLLPLLAFPVGAATLFLLDNPEPHSQQSLRDYLATAYRNIDAEFLGLVGISAIAMLLLYGAYLTYLPLFLRQSFHASPLTIGLLMSTMSISTALTSANLERAKRYYRERTLLAASALLYGLSLAVIPLGPTLASLFIPAVLFGVAMGWNLPIIQTLITELASTEYRAALMAVNATLFRIAQTVAPPLMGLFVLGEDLDPVFYFSAVLALVMMVGILRVIR